MPIKNEITPYVRSLVNLWLAGQTETFTVLDIVRDVKDRHAQLEGMNLVKILSNELIRLENKHKLGSRPGVRGVDNQGVGRVPRVYTIKVKFKVDG